MTSTYNGFQIMIVSFLLVYKSFEVWNLNMKQIDKTASIVKLEYSVHFVLTVTSESNIYDSS